MDTFILFVVTTASLFFLCAPSFSQTSAAAGPWTGWIQCDHDVQGQNYQRREIHTWKITQSTNAGMNGAMYLYSATWSVSGHGSMNRVDGQRSYTGQWTINVPEKDAQLAFRISNDGKLHIQRWGSRLHADHAAIGTRQVTINGTPQPVQNINHSIYEWMPPFIKDSATSTRISGSSETQPESTNAELMPQLGPQHNASCKWEFARGANASVPPPGETTTASNPPQSNPPANNPSGSNPPAGNPVFTGTPRLISVSPNSATYGGDPFEVDLTGENTHWGADTTAVFSCDLRTQKLVAIDATHAKATLEWIPVHRGPYGPCVVQVIANHSETASLSSGFTELQRPAGPLIRQIIPNSAAYGGAPFELSLTGENTHWGSGTIAFFSCDLNLQKLVVIDATHAIATLQWLPSHDAPYGPCDVKVVATTGEVATTLDSAFSELPPAMLNQITPASAQQGQQGLSVNITAKDTHFVQGTTIADFGPGITLAAPLTVTNSTSATAVLNIDPQATGGQRSVTVRTGAEIATLANGFVVNITFTATPLNTPIQMLNAQPSLVAIKTMTPNMASQGDKNVTVTLTGSSTHFVQGTTTADFGSGITLASPLIINSPTSATAMLNVDPAASLGTHPVTVKTGTETVTLAQGFNVSPTLTATLLPPGIISLPAVTQVSPNSSAQGGGSFLVTITGNSATHFSQAASKIDFGSEITVSNVSVASLNSLQVTLAIKTAAIPGTYTVKVTTGTEVAKIVNGFTIAPAVLTGNYRISINGFRVNSETNAGLFGEHNAVYAAAAVEVVDRRSNLATFLQAPVLVRSKVHGDTRKDPNRVRAGSFPPSGGFIAGDVMPLGQDPASSTSTPNTFSFPLLLWQGPLTNGIEAVVVRPTLWVWNGRSDAYETWSRKVTGHVNGFYMDHWEETAIKNNIQLNELTLVRRDDMSLLNCNGDAAFYGTPPPCYPGSDRPIGLKICGTGYTNEVMWCDLAVVVTREIIEKSLASPYQAGGLGKGVVQIHLADFVDSTNSWAGNYDLYLRMERVP